MADRTEQYRRFAERFHAGKRLRPATAAQLAEVEATLGVLLPGAYRQFALACGAVFAPSLTDLVADRRPGYSAPQQFLTPKQAVTETLRWGLDPAGACLAFAADEAGSWFAFRQLPGAAPRPDDAAVWLFDLEDGAATVEAESFDGWVERFLAL
jgi:hypothetical protein